MLPHLWCHHAHPARVAVDAARLVARWSIQTQQKLQQWMRPALQTPAEGPEKTFPELPTNKILTLILVLAIYSCNELTCRVCIFKCCLKVMDVSLGHLDIHGENSKTAEDVIADVQLQGLQRLHPYPTMLIVSYLHAYC
jgi:hypothetical protein